ncbi:MAG: FeoA family protein, partial [Myxococcota bacterium]
MSIKTSSTPGAAAVDRLDSLPLAAQARVGMPEGSSPTLLRLLEMGLVPGSVVQLTRRAPLGDPLEVT